MQMILNIVVIIECLFFMFFHLFNKTKLLSIVQMHNIIWLSAFIFYLFNPLNFYQSCFRVEVYAYVIIYLFVFNMSMLGSKLNVTKKFENTKVIEEFYKKDNIKKCIIASIFTWVIALPILKKSLKVLFGYESLSVGMNMLRYMTYDPSISIFTIPELCIMTYIIRPIGMVCIIYLSEQIAIKKIDLKFFIVTIIDSFLLVLLTAGRAMIVSLIIYIFIAVIVVNKISFLNLIKKYKKFIIPGFFLFVIVVFFSVQRLNRDGGVLTELSIYYFGSIPFFSKLLELHRVKFYSLLGQGTFSALIDPFCMFLKIIGIDARLGAQEVSNTANIMIYIADGIKTNATATTFLTFVMDFGIWGIIIGAMVTGLFAKFYERKFNDMPSRLSFGRYLFIYVAIITSIQGYCLGNIATFSTWVFLYILLR